MEVKKDILWRVYLSYFFIVVVCLVIFSRAVYIQQFEGQFWRNKSDSMHQKIQEVEAERGTIYSEDGKMLSTSIPQFDVFIDFKAAGLREKNGERFYKNLDSLCFHLNRVFNKKSKEAYRTELVDAFVSSRTYYPILKNITYKQYNELCQFPLVRLGRNKSGFMPVDKHLRLNPYDLNGARTIGLDRENAQKVGLEQTYDSLLSGVSGRRLVRYIAGGVSVPIDDYQIEPENGKDIVTTIDVVIQEIAEVALHKMMVKNDAQHGCAIVIETKTGKIKAIANLGKLKKGGYGEDYNYAIIPSEPGSTFKLVTMLNLLEDKKITLNSLVDLNRGVWNINGQTVKDSEKHSHMLVTAQQAFELSSNVGMAKMAWNGYGRNPYEFLRDIHRLRLDTLTGIDLTGERNSIIHKPGGLGWSSTTLPWMAFGYNLELTPLQTAVFYNAIANKGKMMRPYLLKEVKYEGQSIKTCLPHVAAEKICSDSTIAQLQRCLIGVCTNGTAKALFKNTAYPVAGKTGTALVADKNKGYENKIYQSSFAGYFPADDPQYTCVVVIKNKEDAPVFYGADVAGPVFKEIADRLYTSYVQQKHNEPNIWKSDSSYFSFAGSKQAVKTVLNTIKLPFNDDGNYKDEMVGISGNIANVVLEDRNQSDKYMPSLRGLTCKDAVVVSERIGLRVTVRGKGRVTNQSIAPGQYVSNGQLLTLTLD